MIEKDVFRFALTLNDQPILERCFSGENYHQITRSSVNIKDKAKEFLFNIKKILSSGDNYLSFELMGYNLLDMYLTTLKANKIDIKDSLLRVSKAGKLDSEGFYSNEEEKFKFVLYINDKLIIERNFFVKNYNPKSRFSVELLDCINDITTEIESLIKENDKINVYNEFEIHNTYNFPLDKIRLMDKGEKDKLINKIYNN